MLKENKFSIRKFTMGTASVLIGTTIFWGLSNEMSAAEKIEKRGAQFLQKETETKEGQLEREEGAQIAQKETETKEGQLEREEGAQIAQKETETKEGQLEREEGAQIAQKETETKEGQLEREEGAQIAQKETETKEGQLEREEGANPLAEEEISEERIKLAIEHGTVLRLLEKELQNKYSGEVKSLVRTGRSKRSIIGNGEYKSVSAKPTYSLLPRPITESISISSGTTLFNVLENIKNGYEAKLTSEEIEVVRRNLLRKAGYSKNRIDLENIVSGSGSKGLQRKLSSAQASEVNKLLEGVREFTKNRKNPDYKINFVSERQSDVTLNKFSLNLSETKRNSNGKMQIGLNLEKEVGLGTWRYEEYSVLFSDSFLKKIGKVKVRYRGQGREEEKTLTRDKFGYFSYKRPNSNSNQKPPLGGAGGKATFIIELNGKEGINSNEDVVIAKIVSDTTDTSVKRGVSIENEKIDMPYIASKINAKIEVPEANDQDVNADGAISQEEADNL
ncbi:YSIRK-type signal peptide-containing protein, partial [Staphylococcus xylosus]